MEQFFAQLLGPMGGVAALGFGTGGIAGYGFALRSVTAAKIEAIVSPMREKLDNMERQVARLQEELTQERALRERIMQKLLDRDDEARND